jgi:dTDP-glucose 4,6-dehydratase
MQLLVTGGLGFIGSNFIRHVLKSRPDCMVVNLDAVTYAGHLENLSSISNNPRYKFVRGRIEDTELVNEIVSGNKFGKIDGIINFAAETHVDRSIHDPTVFVQTNVMGTQVLLEAASTYGRADGEFSIRFVQVSTDEVYGSLGESGYFTEESPLASNSPYSATKAAADLMCRAYFHTYGLPVITTRCSNNYGPYQHPEKLIPLFITNALQNKSVPVYGDGMNVRDWLHVEDHCQAIDLIFEKGDAGQIYNIGGNNEKTNLDITRLVLQELGKSESLIKFVTDRPGHDRRYAIDSSKMRKELGWTPAYTFEQGIKETVAWYQENTQWVKTVLNQSSAPDLVAANAQVAAGVR